MSRSTPRKSRHRRHPSSTGPRQVPVSDYESDAQHMEGPHEAPNPPPRDNTELSLRVLRRYQPDIRSILAIAANAVAYTFLESTQGWEKHGAEGTMFVCDLEPAVAPGGGQAQLLPRVCVFVLNRRSMDNLVIDLWRATDCEVVGELIVFRLEDAAAAAGQGSQGGDAGADKKIIGLWIHADETNTRELHASLILAAWQQARAASESYLQAASAEPQAAAAAAAAAATGDRAAGRQLSVADLFGQRNGG